MTRKPLRLVLLAGAFLAAHASLAEEAARGPAPDAAVFQGSTRSLFADRTAYRPGDVLTVLITEVASASSTARTRTDKDESASARFAEDNILRRSWDTGIRSDFDGGGDIERSGRLLARLAVVVERVDDQGNLYIRGDQEIHLNNERQRIQLEGSVRAEDVGPDNTVPSWRVSGARIDFIGKGVLARRQRPGLFTRILELFRII
jgi:flagellar L-ring protein FlgH